MNNNLGNNGEDTAKDSWVLSSPPPPPPLPNPPTCYSTNHAVESSSETITPVPPVPPPPAPFATPVPVPSPAGENRFAQRLRVLAGVCAVAALIVGAFALGQLSSSTESPSGTNPTAGADAPNLTELGNDSSVSVNEETNPVNSVLGVETAPLVPSNSLEPVADVADALGPSIVVILTTDGQGSGVVWDAANGYIVTNDHVVAQSNSVDVEFADGQRVVGTVIGSDASRDIAVVAVDPSEVNSLVEAVFAPTSEVRVGQLAVAIGGPFGLGQSVTAGVVSAINRVLLQGGSDPANPSPVEMIQTDAPINPGNSGGALADRQGRVVGINTQIRTQIRTTGYSDGNVGVGFAIPSDTIILIAERIVNSESLAIGFLGIQGETPTDGSPGTLVTSVVQGSPADASGLLSGDLIIAVNGKQIFSMVDLAAEIRLFRPTEAVDILVLRDGSRLTLRAILASA